MKIDKGHIVLVIVAVLGAALVVAEHIAKGPMPVQTGAGVAVLFLTVLLGIWKTSPKDAGDVVAEVVKDLENGDTTPAPPPDAKKRGFASFDVLALSAFACLVVALACAPSRPPNAPVQDILVIAACVDADLTKGMTPAATAVDCGLKDAQAVEDLVGLGQKLAAHKGH